MTVFWVAIAIFSNIICIENRMIPLKYINVQSSSEEEFVPAETEIVEDDPYERVIELKHLNVQHDSMERRENGGTKKPCSAVVLSNVQNPSVQSLLRKYKYDANGVLIPSSVKYYMKLAQEYGSAPLLVPLNENAFTPLGVFVRYYKEVPPIPQSY